MKIPFNKPFLTGNEAEYIRQAVYSGKLSGNGVYTRKCQKFFEDRYGFRKALMTTSCTDALEMAAILCDIKPGDEVIAPSYTFVSSVLAFVRQGARIVFCDSCKDNPDIDPDKIEALITPKTKVIVPVHYAGVACDMDRIMDIAARHNGKVQLHGLHRVGRKYRNPVPLPQSQRPEMSPPHRHSFAKGTVCIADGTVRHRRSFGILCARKRQQTIYRRDVVQKLFFLLGKHRIEILFLFLQPIHFLTPQQTVLYFDCCPGRSPRTSRPRFAGTGQPPPASLPT